MSNNEIDLHGMKVSEAIFHVDDFLKDCHKNNEKEVWIIHGKGKGILREAISSHLSKHPLVARFSTADQYHGAEGAVRVILKKDK
jgi:DNA mismatch repair protein MutS2